MIEEDDHPAHPDERWLVSYADFITLLFALFVLLYALSNSSKAKEAAGMNSVAKAVGMRPTYGMGGGTRPGMGESPGKLMGSPQLAAAKAAVEAAVKQYTNSGVTMTIDSRGLVISLSAAKFFPSGEDQITPAQLPVLDALVKTMAALPNTFQIDGFTDSVPIVTARFQDNWDLSAARASSVLRYTLAHTSISADHLAIAGYGPYHAVGDNSTDEGRALNRRVEVIVKPQEQTAP
jgi:chemotaxis protein MotB